MFCKCVALLDVQLKAGPTEIRNYFYQNQHQTHTSFLIFAEFLQLLYVHQACLGPVCSLQNLIHLR